MAELTPIPSTQRPSETSYQPVSGYAVAAGTITAIFVVAILVLVAMAISSRRMALTWEVLAIPVAGVILAAIGRSHIRNSEGARTGLRIVSISWWVCVLGGAGFAAYLYANSLVLEKESGRFADDFLKELQANRVQEAFENRLVPPGERGKAGPNAPPDVFETAYGAMGYHTFRNHDLVRLFARNSKSLTIERTGSKDISQESSGLQAIHLYRLTCPEGVYEIQIKLTTAESKASNKQQWFIPTQPSFGLSPLSIVDQSQYGRVVMELEREGEAVVRSWTGNLSSGRLLIAHLLTTPASNQRTVMEAINRMGLLGGGAAASYPATAELLPPERSEAWKERMREIEKKAGGAVTEQDMRFQDLAGIGFFRRDEVNSPFPEEKKNHLRELWRSPHLVVTNTRTASVDGSVPQLPVVEVTPDRISVVVSADLFLEGRVHYVRCYICAECTNPELISAVIAARDRGMQSKDDGNLNLNTLPSRDWQITWLRTDMESRAPSGPGAPGAPKR